MCNDLLHETKHTPHITSNKLTGGVALSEEHSPQDGLRDPSGKIPPCGALLKNTEGLVENIFPVHREQTVSVAPPFVSPVLGFRPPILFKSPIQRLAINLQNVRYFFFVPAAQFHPCENIFSLDIC